MRKKVLILTDKEGSHFSQIKSSLSNLNYQSSSCNLNELSLIINNNKSYIVDLNGEEINVDYVVVRYIPGGTLEEIISYLNILKTFELNNTKVINTAENIEKTVDKSLTSLLLQKNNILTPNTYILRDITQVKKFIKDKLSSNKMIYKPMFGSQGDNIQIIENYSDIDNINTIGNIFYIQDFIETNPPHDYRVLAIKNNNKYLMFAMTRHGRNYLNNYSKGAECKYYEIDDDLKAISKNIVNIFKIDFCGIDFIKQDGKYFALEVNSIPAWRGIQSVHDNNITDSFVKCMFE